MHIIYYSIIMGTMLTIMRLESANYVAVEDLSSSQKLLLREKSTSSSTAWMDGLSLDNIHTLACVDKNLKSAVYKARDRVNTLVQRLSHQNSKTHIVSPSIIYNAEGYWCALGTASVFPYSEPPTYHYFFGNTTEFWQDPVKYEMNLRDIRSLRHANGASVFIMKALTKNDEIIMIVPRTCEVWDMQCCNILSNTHTSFSLGHLEETVNYIVNSPFWLKKQLDFDIAAQNAITLVSSAGVQPIQVKCTIDLGSIVFPLYWTENLRRLFAIWHDSPLCTCTTDCIDPYCKKECTELCAIAREENCYKIIPKIQQDFIQHHIISAVIPEDSSSEYTVYSNCVGDISIAYIDKRGRRCFFDINNIEKSTTESAPKIGELGDTFIVAQCAKVHAAHWQIKDGLLYKYCLYNDKKKGIHLLNLFQLNEGKDTYDILSTNLSVNDKIIDIFLTKGPDYSIYLSKKNMETNQCVLVRLYGYRKDISRVKESDTLEDMIRTEKSCTVYNVKFSAREDVINQMMQHIRQKNSKEFLEKKMILKKARAVLKKIKKSHWRPNPNEYFDCLKKEDIDIEKLMVDPYYNRIQETQIDFEPSTTRERLYAAIAAFGDYTFKYDLSTLNCASAVALVSVDLFALAITTVEILYDSYSGMKPTTVFEWLSTRSRVTIYPFSYFIRYAGLFGTFYARDRATNYLQHTMYTVGIMSGIYSLMSFLGGDPLYNTALPLVVVFADALLRFMGNGEGTITFKKAWNHLSMEQRRQLLLETVNTHKN